ncbi:MAG: WD40 repeat protein [Verrucomicrobiales bacterium]
MDWLRLNAAEEGRILRTFWRPEDFSFIFSGSRADVVLNSRFRSGIKSEKCPCLNDSKLRRTKEERIGNHQRNHQFTETPAAFLISSIRFLQRFRIAQSLVAANAPRNEPGSEEQIVVWDAATGAVNRTATHPTYMEALAMAPGGGRFAEADADKIVRIRDSATLKVLKQFRAHDGAITVLAWHPDKPILATGSADLSIKIWNLETGEQLEEIRELYDGPYTLAFSPSGKRLACTSRRQPTRVWELELGGE